MVRSFIAETRAVLFLIDGYNLMHAWGRLGAKLSREGFRRARRRFLDDLALALGPDRAARSTVVFDASAHPGDFPLAGEYRGLRLIFALGDENADARVEELIAAHSSPKALVVVSSDRRVRQAAQRRKSRSIKSEDLLDFLERAALRPVVEPDDRDRTPDPADHDHWLDAFGHLDELLEAESALAPPTLLTDAEIAELEREIESEG